MAQYKGDRDRVVLRLKSDMMRAVRAHCAALDLDVNDVLGEQLEKWWNSQPEIKTRAESFVAEVAGPPKKTTTKKKAAEKS